MVGSLSRPTRNKCWTEDNETIEAMQSATEISIIDKAVSTYEG